MVSPYRFFLGGHDLEMVEIARLVASAGFTVDDKRLAWGARASAYAAEIAAALAAGRTPVLVELAYDLPSAVDRTALVEVDHHGARAGADRPSSLAQVFALLQAAGATVEWTRWHDLVAANDIAHARGMRAIGATVEEIRAVRDADRVAQGITAEVEAASREALRGARRVGTLRLIETGLPTSSAIMDFLLPEYGGPADGVGDTLVVMPTTVAFFGRGAAIAELRSVPGCWYGGALPHDGFWGAPRSSVEPVADFTDRLSALLKPLAATEPDRR